MARGRPRAARSGTDANRDGNGANVGYEAQLWQMADALRGSMDAAEYKHVVLGLIFLKYISDAFEEQHAKLVAEKASGADPEDPDEYRAENIFWVPLKARWPHLKTQRAAADDRPARRRRDGGHRARQPGAKKCAAQGLRPPGSRQDSPRPIDRHDQQHRDGRRG